MKYYPGACRFLASAILISSSVVASADEAEIPNDVRQQIEDYVIEFQSAVQREDPSDMAGLHHLADTVFREVDRAGLALSEETFDQMQSILPERIATQLLVQFAEWGRHTVHIREWDAVEQQCDVLVKIVDSAGTTQKVRFRVERTDDSWFLTDFEDISFGMSFSRLNYITAQQMVNAGPDPEYVQACQNLTQAIQYLQTEDIESARAHLGEIPDGTLPEELEAARWICMATVQIADFDPYTALESVRHAEAFRLDIPVLSFLRASASLEVGDHEAALQAINRFAEECGDDADVAWIRGAALHQLGRSEEAIEILKTGLQETPESADLVVTLATALPEERKQEAGQAFLNLPDPWGSLEIVADTLVLEDDYVSLAAIISAAETPLADHPWMPYYRGEILISRELWEQAAEILEPAIGSDDELVRTSCEQRYAECSARCGRHLEAYRVLPNSPNVFEIMADILLDAESHSALDELIAEHRGLFPDDCQIYWYEGESLKLQDEWEAAEQAFAKGQELCADASEESWVDSEMMMYSRITCLVKLGRTVEGCRELGAGDDVVTLFAQQLLDAEQISELRTLLQEFPLQNLSQRRRWKAVVAFEDRDYDRVITLLQRPESSFWKKLFDLATDDLSEIEWNRLIRSLVHTDKLDEARHHAELYRREFDDSLFVALCEAAAGNVDQSTQLLTECVSDDGLYYAADILNDETWQPYLTDERFAGLKQMLDARAERDQELYGYGDN